MTIVVFLRDKPIILGLIRREYAGVVLNRLLVTSGNMLNGIETKLY